MNNTLDKREIQAAVSAEPQCVVRATELNSSKVPVSSVIVVFYLVQHLFPCNTRSLNVNMAWLGLVARRLERRTAILAQYKNKLRSFQS